MNEQTIPKNSLPRPIPGDSRANYIVPAGVYSSGSAAYPDFLGDFPIRVDPGSAGRPEGWIRPIRQIHNDNDGRKCPGGGRNGRFREKREAFIAKHPNVIGLFCCSGALGLAFEIIKMVH